MTRDGMPAVNSNRCGSLEDGLTWLKEARTLRRALAFQNCLEGDVEKKKGVNLGQQ